MFGSFRTALTRIASLAASLAVVALAPSAANAMVGDKEVAKLVSFGGACAKCELSGRKLTGAQFNGANFAGAALVGSDLREARFYGANFTGADLSRADLSDSEMIGANFGSANLSDAKLRDVEAKGVSFSSANLSNADLRNLQAQGANFGKAWMGGAQLNDGQLAGANFSKTDARGVSFRDAAMQGAVLVGGRFERASFRDTNLDSAVLSGAMFARKPHVSWRHIAAIERACRGASPSAGHHAIATVERHIQRTWVLTQNVDGLHRAAGSSYSEAEKRASGPSPPPAGEAPGASGQVHVPMHSPATKKPRASATAERVVPMLKPR